MSEQGRPGRSPTRRRLLAAAGAAGLGALAGCLAGPRVPDARVTVDVAARRPLVPSLGYDLDLLGVDRGFDDPAVDRFVGDAGATVARFPGVPAAALHDPVDDRYLTGPLERPAGELVERTDGMDAAAHRRAVEAVAALQDRLRADLARAGTAADVDGFLALSEAHGLERLLVCNLSTAPAGADPVDRAAAWVRDLADRGVRVDRFQLGADPAGPAGHFGAMADPARYVAAAERVGAVVAEAFPEASVALAGADVRGTDGGAFNRTAAGAGVGDAVATPAPLRVGYRPSGEPRATTSAALRTASRRGLDGAATAADAIAGGLAETFSGRRGWLTDAGAAVPPSHAGTVLQAVVEGAFLLRWLDGAAGVDLYCRRALFGRRAGVVGGGVDGAEPYATPSYHAAGVVGEALAAATHALDAATVRTATPGGTPAPGPAVHARALLDEGARHLYLPFVNAAGTARAVEVALADGALPSGGRLGGLWIGGALGDRNAAGTPDAVTPSVGNVGIVGGTATIEVPGPAVGALSVALD